MSIINHQPVLRKSCAKCGGSLIKNGLGFWACSRCGEPGRMRYVILLFVVLAGLVASSAGVQAQGQHRSYLPIFRQDPPPATFDLRVMRVGNGRNGSAGCVSPMVPVAASQGDICPLPGDYISLVADNPDSIALGGRQGDGSDAAWRGSPTDFSLIEPAQVIVDADVIEIDVSGYTESAGLFTAPDSDYSVIVLRYTENAVNTAQTEPLLNDQLDFQQTLQKIMSEGQLFFIDWPGDMEFWDRDGLTRFSPAQCGASHAEWAVNFMGGKILTDRNPFWVMQSGLFEPEALARCMGDYRWVKVGEIMTQSAAANVQNRVNQRRGGAVTPFSWVTDAQGTVYAFWSIATGTLAYYGYRVLNAATPNPAMFLFVPNDMLNCMTLAGVKTCTITEGEPGR